MTATSPFSVRLAASDQDLRAAQRLRYDVFVDELGSDGPMVDHKARLEIDAFDDVYDHMLLFDDRNPSDTAIGAYRLLTDEGRSKVGQFYCEDEYDLSAILATGRPVLELGRSCLAKAYRGGIAMMALWQGLAAYIAERHIELLVGVASFHGTDLSALKQPLSYLHHHHLAPFDMRPRSTIFEPMDCVAQGQIDRRAAVAQIPALIKAYLRLGGCVGEGAFVDHAFNTVDVCVLLDIEQMPARQRASFEPGFDQSA